MEEQDTSAARLAELAITAGGLPAPTPPTHSAHPSALFFGDLNGSSTPSDVFAAAPDLLPTGGDPDSGAEGAVLGGSMEDCGSITIDEIATFQACGFWVEGVSMSILGFLALVTNLISIYAFSR